VRIAFVLTQDRGGPVDLTIALARELAGRCDGPEVLIAGPEPIMRGVGAGTRLAPVLVGSKTDVAGARELRTVLRRWDPDVVHAQDRRAALATVTVARTSAPVVATYHGVPDDAAGLWIREGPLAGHPPTPRAAAVLIADALVARRVDALVAPSAGIAEFLRRRLRVPDRIISIVANGVALPPARSPLGPVRTFASVSVFTPAKTAVTIVNAFAAVAEPRPDLRLILVGDGPDRAACERRAAALGIRNRTEFTGYQPDVASQLARAQAFVLPSVNENLPLALIEAMGAGLACVASRIGGIPELFANGSGLLIPPGDTNALAGAMATLADEPGLAASLGQAAAAAARRRFTISACADAHQQLWQRLAGHRRSAP
jgi:glycosyltransferase involved in cell wall biosynthesis